MKVIVDIPTVFLPEYLSNRFSQAIDNVEKSVSKGESNSDELWYEIETLKMFREMFQYSVKYKEEK